MAAFSTIALATLAAASAVQAGTSLARKPKAKAVPESPLPVLPSAPDPVEEERKKRERAALAANVLRSRTLGARGRSDTILTGPAGLTSAAPTQRKTLLGS